MPVFDRALSFVLGNEGGLSDHPADRGGATNLGITAGTLARARMAGIVGTADVRALTRDEAAKIYKVLYWRAARCDAMEAPLCVVHFDAAVNHGIGGAAKLLQRTINNYAAKAGLALSVEVDGGVGPKTLSALDMCVKHRHNVKLLSYIYVIEREAYFRAIVEGRPSQAVFLKGWLARCARCRRFVDGYQGGGA